MIPKMTKHYQYLLKVGLAACTRHYFLVVCMSIPLCGLHQPLPADLKKKKKLEVTCRSKSTMISKKYALPFMMTLGNLTKQPINTTAESFKS
jgi:hypothetical protein